MSESSVNCVFHHVPSDVVSLISSSIGIKTRYNRNNNQVSFSCSFQKAEQIRLTLPNFLTQHPQIWFTMTLPKFSSVFLPFNQNIGNDIHVSFGSLLSTSRFLIHDTPLNNANQWRITFCNEQTLIIECQIDPSIRLTLPMKSVGKTVFVKDSNIYSDIILNIDSMTTNIRINDNNRNDKLYGNHPIVESLNRCSDLLIRISPKKDANDFINFLRVKHQCQIFYTTVSIEHNPYLQWDKIEFNWYSTDDSLYGISMLHSLGYLFDDKYLMDKSLQSIMVDLAEQNEKRFYQLTVKAFNELKKCHWLDLTTIFNQNQFDQEVKNDDELYHINVVHLTPTRLYLMPKEKISGHRALRHKAFQGENDFCLVYLKPDPPEIYLSDNPDALAYIQKNFESGIEIGRNHYHLFGSSNSQLKEHSYWFIKATSLDDIEDKRLKLGELNEINNLGTYVARLGLWFSKSLPTDIKLIYCEDKKEFDKRVQQRERCVMSIDDIERNGYNFTDGNGFISKGLAKTVAEKLNLCSFPSAYQIRMAGCKGLLIIDPQSTTDQFYIKIRPSMKKFQCNDWTLDICEYSQSTPTRLNNQIILLMSDLGVPNETFLRLQQQWFKKKPSCSTSFEYSNLLKNKIPLPVNECRYMFGCAFETRLKPGTCFIRYQVLDENGKSLVKPQFKTVQGRVIVTKNPCPYAGDMLVLEAVDLPELYDLNDLIVFSTTDDRPDFNKIAGSDLDGDKYFVYWGDEFQLKSSVPPLDYTGDKKITHPTRITPKDVIQYCLSTLGATSYGEIYNLHAVIVDQNVENHPQRTCQKLSIELARMFASAIDSGKTGYVINRQRVQEIREKYGRTYPDFLMKYGKEYYRSKSIVGILYRNALLYQKGKIDELNDAFVKLNINNNQLEVSASAATSSLPVNNKSSLSNSAKKKPYSARKSMQ